MRAAQIVIILGICLITPVLAGQPQPSNENSSRQIRFTTVDIYLDSGSKSLAAYQIEFKAAAGQIEIVGIEGGSHPAFAEPPYYDTKAMMNDRVIIADFNTGSDLPKGKTRIVTIHLQITGGTEPVFQLELIAAADEDGNQISAEISLEEGE